VDKDSDAADVFESVKELTVARKLSGFERVHAFANGQKPLSHIYMLFSTTQSLHIPPIAVGIFTRPETNLGEWALVLGQRLGASRI
jgi:hypothetical protein